MSMPSISQGFTSLTSSIFSFGRAKDVTFSLSSIRVSLPMKGATVDIQTLRDHNAMQPISRLPTELLCNIFTVYVKDPTRSRVDHSFPRVSSVSSADPTLLGQVCSHWRAVAINLPKLWSTIFIRNPRETYIYLTQVWLERAAEQPLNITLWGSDIDDLASYASLLSAFVSRSQFWKIIDIIPPLDLIPHFRDLLQHSQGVHILESVRFSRGHASPELRNHHRSHQGWEIPYIRDIWSFFYTSTALRDVGWSGTFGEFLHDKVPYSQLNIIWLNGFPHPDAEDVLGFMSRFPQLQHLDILGISPPSLHRWIKLPTLPTTPLIVEHLHTLHLSATTPLSFIFTYLALPSLKDLRLVSMCCPGPLMDGPSLQEFFQRSKCRLERLVYFDPQLASDGLRPCLQLPELQPLIALECTGIVTDLTISLFLEQYPDGTPAILPILQTLCLKACETTDGLLSTMVSFRGGILKDVDLRPRKEEFGPLDKEALQPLILVL